MNSTPRTRPVSLLLAILLAVVPTGQQSRGEEPQSASVRAFQSAAALYDSGKVAEALTALHSFEAQYQFSAAVPQAIYLQGLCWARLHKCREAINTFERLRKGYGSAPVIPEAILKQAECNQELKNYPTALELYREFESTYPRHRLLSQAVLGEAWANLQQGDAAAAQAILQRALTQFADDPGTILRVRLLTGQVLTAEKRYDEAFQVYKNVTTEEYDSRASDAFFLAGESFFDAGRWTEAIECYRRVQPRAALIAHLQEQIEALENRQTNSVRQAAVAASEHEINDLRERLTRCEDGPDFGASALYRIASCHESLGHINQALAAYSQFLSRYPTDKVSEEARVGLIRTLVAGRQFADAVAAATDFQARYPSSSFGADVSLLEAEALLASGKTTEALVRFEKLAATNPPLPILETVEFHIGACYYSLREFDRARDSFQAFVRDHPDSAIVPDALFRLGRCYVELAQDMTDSAVVSTNLTAAVATYEQLRELYPTNATIREVTFQLGYLNASLASGDRDSAGDSASKICHADAVKFFGEFVNRWADDALVPEAMYQLGRNEYALGRFDDALGSFEHLVRRFPDTRFAPLAFFEIARCYGAENKNTDMVMQLHEFVARYPTQSLVGTALYAIGRQLEHESRTDQAITAYRDVIARAASVGGTATQLRQAAIDSEVRIASILVDRGDTEKAVTDCEAFLTQFGDDPAAAKAMVAQIAGIYQSAQHFDDGYVRLDRLAAAYSHNDAVRVAAITGTIELALAAGDRQRAYTGASQLLADPEKDHLSARSYVAVGNVLLQRGQAAQAREEYKESLRLDPGDTQLTPLARLGIGRADLALNRLDEADQIFRQMVNAQPPGSLHDRANLGLAEVYLARGGVDPQSPHVATAIELLASLVANAKGEDSGEAAYLLGNCYFALGGATITNKKTALAYYLRASLVLSGPHGEEAAFRSGVCQKALGNPGIARRAFEAYLRRFPHGQFVADAKKELESLPARSPGS